MISLLNKKTPYQIGNTTMVGHRRLMHPPVSCHILSMSQSLLPLLPLCIVCENWLVVSVCLFGCMFPTGRLNKIIINK